MRAADTAAVADLLRESYDPALRRFISHAQAGVQEFLRVHLEHPALFAGTELTVAAHPEDDRVLGFCEFTVRPGGSHLGYICVAPDARGRGVATALVEEHVGRRRPGQVTLDVFEDNVPARALYDRLGFVAVAERAWYVRPLPLPTAQATVLNGHEAVATHARYGFSNLQVATPGGTRTVGRTGGTVLRCRTVEDFEDDALLASVRGCVGDVTDALVIVAADERQPHTPGLTVATRSARLELRRRTDEGPGRVRS